MNHCLPVLISPYLSRTIRLWYAQSLDFRHLLLICLKQRSTWMLLPKPFPEAEENIRKNSAEEACILYV